MTNYDIVIAGHELDVLIAEKMMRLEVINAASKVSLELGNERIRSIGDTRKWIECSLLPKYSTDITAAWEVVEKLRLSIGPSIDSPTGWYCALMGSKIHGTTASTAPLAICRAALKTVNKVP